MRSSLFSLLRFLLLVGFALSSCTTFPQGEPALSPSPTPPEATESAPAEEPQEPNVTFIPPNPSPEATAEPPRTPEGPDRPIDSGEQPMPPSPPSWLPSPKDRALLRGPAFIQTMDLLVLESFPPQYVLYLAGTLPTPCHEIRVEVNPPDDQRRIVVSVYSVSDPRRMCIQVLSRFEVRIPLTQNLPSGKFTVWVNDKPLGEIEVP